MNARGYNICQTLTWLSTHSFTRILGGIYEQAEQSDKRFKLTCTLCNFPCCNQLKASMMLELQIIFHCFGPDCFYKLLVNLDLS